MTRDLSTVLPSFGSQTVSWLMHNTNTPLQCHLLPDSPDPVGRCHVDAPVEGEEVVEVGQHPAVAHVVAGERVEDHVAAARGQRGQQGGTVAGLETGNEVG